MKYIYTTEWECERVTVKQILDNWHTYYGGYFFEKEGEKPSSIRNNSAYLQTLHPNKKVYVCSFPDECGKIK